jgi:hypothetical protein
MSIAFDEQLHTAGGFVDGEFPNELGFHFVCHFDTTGSEEMIG